MKQRSGRIRRGELIAAGGGVVLLAALFLLPWFVARAPAGGLAADRAPASLDGWQALTTARWILLVTIAIALALGAVTAARRAPAVPLTLAMLSSVFGAVSSLLLVYRIFDHPGLSARAGVFVGIAAAVGIAYGGYLSLRTEGGPFIDPDAIETVSLGRTAMGSAGRADSTSARPSGP